MTQFSGLLKVVRERGGDGTLRGRPWSLPLAERVLMIAVDYRTNLTMRQLGPLFGVSSSTVCRVIQRLGPVLALEPALVELVRRHLAVQSEPWSAAEVTAGLDQAHPDRAVQTTVVRNTLEGLVAKQHAQRTKQCSSVYYTATGGPEPVAASEASAQAEKSK
ncbi:helix-turn-helix domain-containing protein [Streptomyces olivaceus]|uniref:helix-turn-helix domain-containing protein n=1 Tax=Streptomyces olivaceus TaxID=47716 RepID=UPI001CCEB707|nr:transposase family protein [Streptomyces olivaceus]